MAGVTAQGVPYGLTRLAGGALAEVDWKGKATLLRCSWLVEVPSGCPEPDSPSDMVMIIPCGAKVRPHPGYPNVALGDATLCDNGHDRLPIEIDLAPFGPQWEREMVEERGS